VSFLCQHDHARLAGEIMAEVVEAHHVDASPELAAVGRDGPVVAVRDRARDVLRLGGWLDLSCAPAVSEVIDAHGDGPLRLDLADLSFVDVAGMRALRGRRRRSVVIIAASDAVRRLLPLLAWDTDPKIELQQPA
jgi:anti-anti-sigma regulatory factor